MGLNEIPGDKDTLTEKEWFVHLEVLSTDNRMPGFLSNPGELTVGNPLIRAVRDKTLYVRAANANPPEFTATTARLNSSVLLDRYAATPVRDKDDKEWFKVTESGWLPRQDIKEIAQFDLLRQGFQPLGENSTGAATDSVRENWIAKVFGKIAAAADEASKLNYANVPEYYRDLMTTMDADHDGNITAEEIRAALTVRDPLVKEGVHKFIVKQHSEWFGGRSTGRWEEFYRQLDPIEKAYCEKWQEKLEWMSQVEPFKEGKPIWHFHPVVFLNFVKNSFKITKQMLRKIWINSSSVSDDLLENVARELTASLDLCNIDSANRLYHFMSQVYQEVGPDFKVSENLNYRPNVLKLKFSYYKNHASEADEDGFISGRQAAQPEKIANKVYASRVGNGDYESGDGWKYRGRGIKQLTFRSNYRSFTIYHEAKWREGVDFEEQPDLLLSTKYATRSALYFWDYNKLFDLADKGYTKEVSYSITKIVNYYDDHYDDRFENLKRFLEEKVFDGLL